MHCCVEVTESSTNKQHHLSWSSCSMCVLVSESRKFKKQGTCVPNSVTMSLPQREVRAGLVADLLFLQQLAREHAQISRQKKLSSSAWAEPGCWSVTYLSGCLWYLFADAVLLCRLRMLCCSLSSTAPNPRSNIVSRTFSSPNASNMAEYTVCEMSYFSSRFAHSAFPSTRPCARPSPRATQGPAPSAGCRCSPSRPRP
jgi:hypothetical protein